MRILLADDHELVRDAIAAVLRKEADFNVVTAGDLHRAGELLQAAAARGEAFDMVLLDYMMPGMNGLVGLAAIRKLTEGRPVAILSGAASRTVAEQALKDGAAGFLPKTMSTRALVAAVRFMAAGEVYAPMSLMAEPEMLRTQTGTVHLTQRERDVLQGLCRSLSNKEIALELDLQEVTVKLHVKSLFRKIGAKNRSHALLIAMEGGLLWPSQQGL